MSSFIIILIAGFLIIVPISVVALIYAVTHAVEGYEVASKFHQVVPDEPANLTPLESRAASWDEVEDIALVQEQWMI